MDWTKSMQQTFEFYEVDPETWKDKKRLDMFLSATIDRDDTTETLGSASFEVTEELPECYVRTYLVANQNGEKFKVPLGTFLVQAPSDSFDGKIHTFSMDGYTPLLELKENQPPLGYFVGRSENILDRAYQIVRNYCRAPVVKPSGMKPLTNDFIAETDDTWYSFTSDLIANANYSFDLEGDGTILFSPNQDTASLQPVWTYTDDNSSILYPEITLERDIYSIPNVVEVLYSVNSGYLYAKAVNDDKNSPTSTKRRGREITHRVTDPELHGYVTQADVKEYAKNLLRELSTLDCRLTYSHGYNGVRVKDCVRLNYARSGLVGIKAKVISQSISCTTGCKIQETAVFTKQLWG